jgi:hypothetical protein
MNELVLGVVKYCAYVVVYSTLLIPLSLIFLAKAIPDFLRLKYFRRPYFNDGDDQLFALFPFRYVLTFWLAQMTAWKWFANRRGAKDLWSDSPTQWRVMSVIYIWGVVVPVVTAFFTGVICLFYLSIG